jgi:hypothetical protein
MKRSQMLGKLWTLLYTKTDYYEEDLKDLAEDILDTLEHEGMQPPSFFHDDGDLGSKYINDWENEK